MRQYFGAMGAQRLQSGGNRSLSHVSLPFGAFLAQSERRQSLIILMSASRPEFKLSLCPTCL
jgi:hypothetical protein